jgi:hypothetical protein
MKYVLDAEQIRFLREMDVDAAIARMPAHVMVIMTSRENCLAGLHKARVQTAEYFTLEEVQQSCEWLTSHDFKVPK